jgi:transcriptional regulator
VYIPSAFAETRPEVLGDFLRQHSFGTLVTSDPEAGLCASHLPFLFTEAHNGGHAKLVAHVARQNDQWRALRPDTEVLVIFQGPHAYVSPRWYEATPAVPTWNYTAVHAYGRPRLIEDPPKVRKVLSDMVIAYEGTGETAWSDSELPHEFVEKMASAVVAFSIDVTRMEGQFKLSQNRSAADQLGVIGALEADHNSDARAVADLMREGMIR